MGAAAERSRETQEMAAPNKHTGLESCLKVVKKLSRLKAWMPSTPSKTAGGDGTPAGKPLITCFLSRKFEPQNRHLPVFGLLTSESGQYFEMRGQDDASDVDNDGGG